MATVEARITGVEQDATNGWYRISTDDATIKRLDTKIAEKAKEAADLKKRGVLALIEFSEKQSATVNQHTGRPYLNRYYEQAGPANMDDGEDDDGITRVKPTRPQADPEEAWRISLSAGGKLAVATLPHLPEAQKSFDAQKQIALAWGKFFYYTPPPPPEWPTAELNNVSNDEPTVDAEADGIPF